MMLNGRDRAMAFRDEIQPCGIVTAFAAESKMTVVSLWTDDAMHRKYFTRLADAVVYYKPTEWYLDSALGLVFVFKEELV